MLIKFICIEKKYDTATPTAIHVIISCTLTKGRPIEDTYFSCHVSAADMMTWNLQNVDF